MRQLRAVNGLGEEAEMPTEKRRGVGYGIALLLRCHVVAVVKLSRSVTCKNTSNHYRKSVIMTRGNRVNLKKRKSVIMTRVGTPRRLSCSATSGK